MRVAKRVVRVLCETLSGFGWVSRIVDARSCTDSFIIGPQTKLDGSIMKKVALVTGADRGLGLGLTKGLLELGWTVVAGRHLDWPELDDLETRYPATLITVALDVSSDASVRRAAALVGQRVDHLDLLISNAAINRSHDVETLRQSPSFDDMIAEFNTNALGGLRVTDAFLPLLDAGHLKRLCYVSSEAGSVEASSRKGWFGYCMSKAATHMAVKNLSNDLVPQGYTFRLYHPGYVRSYMRGAKNLEADLEPNDAAKIALEYFLSDEEPKPLRLHCWNGEEMPW